MQRWTGALAIAVLSGIILGLFIRLPYAEARGGNCAAKLVDNSYDCTLKENDNPPQTDCLEFLTGGTSQYFDLILDTGDWGCACDPTGSPNSPSFDNSSTPLSARQPSKLS